MTVLPSIDDLVVFAAVADSGGFTRAAARLGTTTGGVSRRVRALEARLGGDLFVRTTRQVRLTEAGRLLHERAAPALATLHQALHEFGAGRRAPSGHLRLTAPVDHAAGVLAPVLARFRERYPEVSLELQTSDSLVDLVAGGIDLALRLGQLRDSSLKASRLGSFEQVVVAAPDYVRRMGLPRLPEELAGHRWVAFTRLRSPLTWTFTDAAGRRATVRMRADVSMDASSTLRAFLECAGGVSVLDEHSVAASLRQGRLVRLLPDWRLPRGGIHAVLPPGRFVPPLVRAFLEVYREALGARP